MTVLIDAVARAVAYTDRRPVVSRSTSTLSPEPRNVFGIALIKVASEEQIQAIAYGDPDGEPQVLVRWNPMSRESGDLEAFAAALDAYLAAAGAAGDLPRIWVPHGKAVELLDVLAWRYRTNRQATDELRRMGGQCRAIVEEHRMPDQQVVAVAGDLLKAHVTTGMSPLKEAHLGAILAWVAPEPGTDPVVESEIAALRPASGLLERPDDDLIEALRKQAKRGDERARARIEGILERGVRSEWARLIRSRRAFLNLNLGLAVSPRIGDLVQESRDRITWALAANPNPPTRPDALSAMLEREEYALDLRADVDVRTDARVRERARRAGRAIAASVVGVVQPRPRFRPCTLVLRTEQAVLRVRRGTTLSDIVGRVDGRVAAVREEPGTGATLIELEVERGVRSIPALGAAGDWVDSLPFDAGPMMARVNRALRDQQPALAYDEQLPPPIPRDLGGVDLLAISQRLRR